MNYEKKDLSTLIDLSFDLFSYSQQLSISCNYCPIFYGFLQFLCTIPKRKTILLNLLEWEEVQICKIYRFDLWLCCCVWMWLGLLCFHRCTWEGPYSLYISWVWCRFELIANIFYQCRWWIFYFYFYFLWLAWRHMMIIEGDEFFYFSLCFRFAFLPDSEFLVFFCYYWIIIVCSSCSVWLLALSYSNYYIIIIIIYLSLKGCRVFLIALHNRHVQGWVLCFYERSHRIPVLLQYA